MEALERGELLGASKLRLLREASTFYHGLCPKPTSAEYSSMAKALCTRFPQLKDKKPVSGQSWVCCCMHVDLGNKSHACYTDHNDINTYPSYIVVPNSNVIITYVQESVKVYLSQRYRNLRRSSEPLVTAKREKKKLVTAAHASPVAQHCDEDSCASVSITGEDDLVAYERNHKALVEEHNSHRANHSMMHKLLKLTYKIRRDKITSSVLSTTALKEEYPFFNAKKWVI